MFAAIWHYSNMYVFFVVVLQLITAVVVLCTNLWITVSHSALLLIVVFYSKQILHR